MACRGPGGFGGLNFGSGPDLFLDEWRDGDLGREPDLEEVECFLIRDFNGQPPYSGVRWSTTDIILCRFSD